MKLYFGNRVAAVTAIMICVLLGFIGYSVWNRRNIQFWGRRSLFLLFYGLVVCCFAAARDSLDKTIQCAIVGSCAPGVFQLVSVPTISGCGGAAIILIAAVSDVIAMDAAHQRTLVLHYVQRYGAENCHCGDIQNPAVNCLGAHNLLSMIQLAC